MNKLERFLKYTALLLPVCGVLLLFTDVMKYIYAAVSVIAGIYIFSSTKKSRECCAQEDEK